MAWDSVPWFVGGGAQHSPEVGRLLAYAATSGSEGIVGTSDLTVSPLAVPAGKVRVSPGACVIPNRSTGGSQQSYVGRLPTEDVVAIAPTGSGAGRIDLIVARVEDPFAAGTPWQDPDDPTVGPYIFTRVIPNVQASDVATYTAARALLVARGESAIPLASVTMPANTGTVTAGLIKSLRSMANPRRQRRVMVLYPGATTYSPVSGAPRAQFTNMDNAIETPTWATEVKLIVTGAGIGFSDAVMTGRLRADFGFTADGTFVSTQDVGIDGAPGTRQTLVVAGELAVPASYRGRTNNVRLNAQGVTGAGRFFSDAYCTFVIDAEFVEVPE